MASTSNWKPSNIFQIYAPYFQNGWSGLNEDMAADVILTSDRFDGDPSVVVNEDGSMEAYNPYTGFMVQAPSKKALLAFGMKETKRHLEGFDISPWTDFLYDAAGAMTLDGSDGVVDIDMRVVEDVLQSPLMPLNGGTLALFQHNLTGLAALGIRYRPDGSTYIPGLSPVARMASCVCDATDPRVAFASRPGSGRLMSWIFDSKGVYTHYGKNILKMINQSDLEVADALATAYTVAKNRQKSRM